MHLARSDDGATPAEKAHLSEIARSTTKNRERERLRKNGTTTSHDRIRSERQKGSVYAGRPHRPCGGTEPLRVRLLQILPTLFGLCIWDGCIAEGAAAVWVATAAATAVTAYAATHQDELRAAADATSTLASGMWDGIKTKIKTIGLLGGLTVLGGTEAGAKLREAVDAARKARVEAEELNSKIDEEETRKKDKEKRGTGAPGGSGDGGGKP